MDYEAELAELEQIKKEAEEAFRDFAMALSGFASAFYQAAGIVPFFEGDDAALLLAMGIAP